jgi:hypothetical protein
LNLDIPNAFFHRPVRRFAIAAGDDHTGFAFLVFLIAFGIAQSLTRNHRFSSDKTAGFSCLSFDHRLFSNGHRILPDPFKLSSGTDGEMCSVMQPNARPVFHVYDVILKL